MMRKKLEDSTRNPLFLITLIAFILSLTLVTAQNKQIAELESEIDWLRQELTIRQDQLNQIEAHRESEKALEMQEGENE